MTDIGATLARIERRLAAVERSARLSSASLDDTALEVRDSDGSLRAIVGQQGDGTTAVNIVNGPVPPVPSPPAVASALAALTVTWNGTFDGAAAAPLDWMRCEVHVGATPDFVPAQGTLRDTIETPQGGTASIPLPYTEWHVKLRSRSSSGAVSEATPAVAGTPRKAATVDLVAGSITADLIAVDALNGKTITGGTITGGTVTGSVIQTGTTGTRLTMGPNAGGTGIPGVALYSGAAAETAPGLLWSAVTTVGTATQPMTVVQAPYVDSGSARLDLASPAVGQGGQFKVTTSTSRDYAYIFGADGAAAGTSLLELYAQNGTSGGSSVLQVKGDEIYMRSPVTTVNGIMAAKNFASGSVAITPSAANTPTSVSVTGLAVAGNTLRAFVSIANPAPGYTAANNGVTGVGFTNLTSAGLTIWATRQNTTAVSVHWFVYGYNT
ncbi:hypothetical protein AB0E67_27045 [Streptomyces sp. NPDC032161]|uniref:hypothetical protein n=1 Tax=unclassified Streptomyces TaxID=2593676 RepID=UPI0033C97EB5